MRTTDPLPSFGLWANRFDTVLLMCYQAHLHGKIHLVSILLAKMLATSLVLIVHIALLLESNLDSLRDDSAKELPFIRGSSIPILVRGIPHFVQARARAPTPMSGYCPMLSILCLQPGANDTERYGVSTTCLWAVMVRTMTHSNIWCSFSWV